jgi:hypothetical protein
MGWIRAMLERLSPRFGRQAERRLNEVTEEHAAATQQLKKAASIAVIGEIKAAKIPDYCEMTQAEITRYLTRQVNDRVRKRIEESNGDAQE